MRPDGKTAQVGARKRLAQREKDEFPAAACRVLEQGRAVSGDMTLKVAIPVEYAPLVVEKGSVAVDGVSLTVAALGDDWFSVCLIPETWRRTALPERIAGSTVNV